MEKNRNRKISVLLVDDHRMVREGLKKSLAIDSSIAIVDETGYGLEAVQKAARIRPDVILMDINLPDFSGIEATRRIICSDPAIKVIGLTMYSDKAYVMGMMKAGATGFLTKTCSARELSRAICSVFSGHTYLCDEVAGGVVETALNPALPGDTRDTARLTRRESQILKLIAEGMTSRDIGKGLGISKRTVERHRKNLMDKLKIKTVANLTKFSIRQGLTSLD